MVLPWIEGARMMPTASMPLESEFEVHFRSLLRRGLELIFPCDCKGHVDLDSLSERAKANYLFARAMVGREFARPAVHRHDPALTHPVRSADPSASAHSAAR